MTQKPKTWEEIEAEAEAEIALANSMTDDELMAYEESIVGKAEVERRIERARGIVARALYRHRN